MWPIADRGGQLQRVALNYPFKVGYVCNWQILLKKSKIERLRKSREGRLLGLSAAARLFKTNRTVRGCVCLNRCGPSRRRAWNASAVQRNLGRLPKRTFSTLSALSRHVVAVAACRLLGDERTSIRHRLRSEFDPYRKSSVSWDDLMSRRKDRERRSIA
jgi:hypothetical protein